MHIEDVTGSAN